MTSPAPVLSGAELQARLGLECPAWRPEGGAIVRTLRSGGWKGSLLLANAIGHLAELAWHHPELTVTFGAVTIRLSTHDASGVTAKDLELAARIDALVDWRPGSEEGALDGIPPGSRHAYPGEP